MKETRYKGVISSIFGALFCLILSLFSAYTTVMESGADNLYKNGQVLTDTTTTGKVAVEVIGIYPEALAETEEGSSVYLLVYALDDERYSYIGFEAHPNDKVLTDLIVNQNTLADQPKRIEAEVISAYQKAAIQDYSAYMTDLFKENAEIGQWFEKDRYLSITEITEDKWWNYGFSIVAFALFVFCLYKAVKHYRNNKQVYDTLYTTYPELSRYLEQLVQGANYHQEKLGLLIYKNHLLSYRQSLTLVELPTIASLHHEVINHKRYFITISRTSSLKIGQTNGKTLAVAIKNIGRTTDDELQGLFSYLNTHHPAITLGYRN